MNFFICAAMLPKRVGVEDNGVVFDEIVNPRHGRDLVKLVMRSECQSVGDEFGHPLDVNVSAGAAGAVGLGVGEPLDVSVAR